MTDRLDADVADTLRTMTMPAQEWDRVEGLLADLATGHDVADALRAAVFEGRVRHRFSGPRQGGAVAATKQVSVLPVVGGICAALLVAVGGLLGGGLVLVGVVALGVGVFAVAVTGSRVAHRNASGRHDGEDVGPAPIPAPPAVLELLETMDWTT